MSRHLSITKTVKNGGNEYSATSKKRIRST